MASLAERIREDGIELESVSLGSTPTAEYAAEVRGSNPLGSTLKNVPFCGINVEKVKGPDLD